MPDRQRTRVFLGRGRHILTTNAIQIRRDDRERAEARRQRCPRSRPAVLLDDKDGDVVGIRRDQVRKADARHVIQTHAPLRCPAVEQCGCCETSTRSLEWSRCSKAPPTIPKNEDAWAAGNHEVKPPVAIQIASQDRGGRASDTGVDPIQGELAGGGGRRERGRVCLKRKPRIRGRRGSGFHGPPTAKTSSADVFCHANVQFCNVNIFVI